MAGVEHSFAMQVELELGLLDAVAGADSVLDCVDRSAAASESSSIDCTCPETAESQPTAAEASRLAAALGKLRDTTRIAPAAGAMAAFWKRVAAEKTASPMADASASVAVPVALPVSPVAAAALLVESQTQVEAASAPAARAPWEFAPYAPHRMVVAADSAWRPAAALPAVKAGAAAPEKTTMLVDLLDWCEGRLDDGASGAVERALAASPEAQVVVRSVGKLSAALHFLREESKVPTRPDALSRFQERVSAELDAELGLAQGASPRARDAADCELVSPASQLEAPVAGSRAAWSWDDASQETVGRSQRTWLPGLRGVSRWIVAACLFLAAGCGVWALVQPDSAADVLASFEKAETVDELRALHPGALAMVGETLLDWEQARPQDLAAQQLLSHLTEAAASPRALETARRLARQQRQGARWGLARLPFAIPTETKAFAASGEGETVPAAELSTMRRAIREQRWSDVERLAAGWSQASGAALHVWALHAQGQDEAAAARLSELEAAAGARGATLLLRTFAAGAWQAVERPLEALSRFRSLQVDLPGLSLQIGCLYEFDLKDDQQARPWFERFARSHGPSADDAFAGWSPIGRDEPRAILSTQWQVAGRSYAAAPRVAPVDQDPSGMEWLSIRRGATSSELFLDDVELPNYELNLRIRFAAADGLAARPRLVLQPRRKSSGDAYRAVVGLDRLSLGRVASRTGLGIGSTSLAQAIALPASGADGLPAPADAVSQRAPFNGVQPEVWQRVRLQVRSIEGRTELLLKVWPASDPEPDGWQVAAEDVSGADVAAGLGLAVIDGQATLDQVWVQPLAR